MPFRPSLHPSRCTFSACHHSTTQKCPVLSDFVRFCPEVSGLFTPYGCPLYWNREYVTFRLHIPCNPRLVFLLRPLYHNSDFRIIQQLIYHAIIVRIALRPGHWDRPCHFRERQPVQESQFKDLPRHFPLWDKIYNVHHPHNGFFRFFPLGIDTLFNFRHFIPGRRLPALPALHPCQPRFQLPFSPFCPFCLSEHPFQYFPLFRCSHKPPPSPAVSCCS